MRLSTAATRDDDNAVAVIRAALDAGATLLDTANAYGHTEADVGHNERVIARALDGWVGERARITVATKGGMRRPNGSWVPDGRATHIRDACEASRRALGVDVIDLYQLHAVDPKTQIETSVRALARLREEGKIRAVGLCNVTVTQIKAAQSVTEVDAVQVSLSPLDAENLRNGVAEYCRDNGIRVIAHRPLGGDRIKRLGKNAVVTRVAGKHAASKEEVVLAWLMTFGDGVVPIPGASRVETATSLARALGIELDDEDCHALDAEFSGRLLRIPRVERRPADDAEGDVVIVMGSPGAGKTVFARDLEGAGYARLNRDALGGSLADLAPRLDSLLAGGSRRVVLDNTYPTRASRNEIVETAWARGVPARCIWMATDVPNAQINSILRMLDVHGGLPTPEDIRALGKADTRYLSPDAQFRYERILEPPALDEGFVSIEEHTFVRTGGSTGTPGLIFDFDDLVGTVDPVLRAADVKIDEDRCAVLRRYSDDGWLLFVHAWRPQVSRGVTTREEVDACVARLQTLLGIDSGAACCPHDAGPPACWCRKPIPGSVLELAKQRGVSLTHSIVVGSSAADRTMAERIGARFEPSASFWTCHPERA